MSATLLGLVAAATASQITNASFDFKGVPLGISYEEFRSLPHPDGKQSQVVCTGDKISVLGIATDPPGVSIYNAVEKQIGVRKCIWLATSGYEAGGSSGLGLAGTMYAANDYSFSFVPDPRDGVVRLFRFEGITNINAEDAVVQALTAKFGRPRVANGVIQNRIGNRFDQVSYTWTDTNGSISVQSPAVEVNKMTIMMVDTRLSNFVEHEAATRRAAIPNGI